MAGTTTLRITNASTGTANARPKPNVLMVRLLPRMNSPLSRPGSRSDRADPRQDSAADGSPWRPASAGLREHVDSGFCWSPLRFGRGFYREQVLPRLVDRACSTAGMTSWRAAVTDGLEGRVVEIGFGSGLNPSTIRRRWTSFSPWSLLLWRAVSPSGASPRRGCPSSMSASTTSRFRSLTPASTRRCRRSPSAPSPTSTKPWPRYDASFAPGIAFTFSSTALPPDPAVVAWQRRRRTTTRVAAPWRNAALRARSRTRRRR